MTAARRRLIIVSGLPCTGKSTLGRYLAHELGLPILHKDAIKERLFDELGWSNRAWSKRLSQASNALLLDFVEASLSAGISLVAESNFGRENTSRLNDLLTHYKAQAVQIHCTAAPEVVFERFQQRVIRQERHPGHVDAEYLPELAQLLQQPTLALPLPLAAELTVLTLTVNTTPSPEVASTSVASTSVASTSVEAAPAAWPSVLAAIQAVLAD